jgi:UDP-N-acetylglucosamine acyltransferase
VDVGPLAIIEAGVIIGEGCTIAAGAILKTGTTLGPHNKVAERATIGGLPQHVNVPDQVGTIAIGSHNTIREGVTIHRALHEGHTTLVGDHNLLMVGAHVAHDCVVGNHAIFANNATLGGHVVVHDRAYVSGNVAVHQFCHIGRLAMVGGLARVIKDVPPYVTIDGNTGYVVGLNTIGLRRAGYSHADISQLKAAYRTIYRSGLKWNAILERMQTEFNTGPAAEFGVFFQQISRGIVPERRLPPGAGLKLGEEAMGEPILRKQAG